MLQPLKSTQHSRPYTVLSTKIVKPPHWVFLLLGIVLDRNYDRKDALLQVFRYHFLHVNNNK